MVWAFLDELCKMNMINIDDDDDDDDDYHHHKHHLNIPKKVQNKENMSLFQRLQLGCHTRIDVLAVHDVATAAVGIHTLGFFSWLTTPIGNSSLLRPY